MRVAGRLAAFLMMLATWVPTAQSVADPLEQQRHWFQQAREALDAGKMGQFKALRQKLDQYPLAPYLDIWLAWKGLPEGNDWQVADVLARYADIPESQDLQLAWIENLAGRGQWPQVALQLKRLPVAATRLPEITMLSLWYNGNHDAALERFGGYWQQGRHFSKHSARLEKAWFEAGHPHVDETWHRIGELASKGKWSEADRLAEVLPKQQHSLLGVWRKMQQEPLEALEQWPQGKVPPLPAELMLSEALRRLSRDNVVAAWQQLQRLEERLKPAVRASLKQHVALRGARQHQPEAISWLKGLPAAQKNAETRAWQVRLHLLQDEWKQAWSVIDAMPAAEKSDSRWVYWQARCLAAMGQQERAGKLFADLAEGRGYHSFLAAEYIGLPYRLQNSEPSLNNERINRLAEKAAIRRAHEWWQLQEPGKAGREWYAALADADAETWEAAAGLANLWGWYDRTIYSTYRAGAYDALSYRFPLGYEKTVAKVAEKNGLHASLIWSVIRQESGFNMQAVSRTGARGLMQLMPATARDLANGRADLFDPKENIRLGSRYLAQLARRFDGNEAVAVAAYNAGPSRVSDWLEHTPFKHADVWIEAIPYSETRHYVQQVMAYMIVYDWRQEKEPLSLTARMRFATGDGEASGSTDAGKSSG